MGILILGMCLEINPQPVMLLLIDGMNDIGLNGNAHCVLGKIKRLESIQV